jgi:hypothetical protein
LPLWSTLDPTGRSADASIGASAWLEARDTSLAAEWLALLRA